MLKKKAEEINGRSMQFFEDRKDIEWALDVHVYPNQGFTKENTDGVILIGNEDCPDEVWLTRKIDRKKNIPANHIKAVFTLVGTLSKGELNFRHP